MLSFLWISGLLMMLLSVKFRVRKYPCIRIVKKHSKSPPILKVFIKIDQNNDFYPLINRLNTSLYDIINYTIGYR